MEELEDYIKKLKNVGILRRIDELGRIVIPIEYRNDTYVEGTKVYYKLIDDYIILYKNNEDKSGIGRTIDELGRVTIKIEIREVLDLKEKDRVSVWCFKDYIILKKYEEKCVFCRRENNLIEFKKKMICSKCKDALVRI